MGLGEKMQQDTTNSIRRFPLPLIRQAANAEASRCTDTTWSVTRAPCHRCEEGSGHLGSSPKRGKAGWSCSCSSCNGSDHAIQILCTMPQNRRHKDQASRLAIWASSSQRCLVSSFKSQYFIFFSHLEASNLVVNLLISSGFLCKGPPVWHISAFTFQEVPSIQSQRNGSKWNLKIHHKRSENKWQTERMLALLVNKTKGQPKSSFSFQLNPLMYSQKVWHWCSQPGPCWRRVPSHQNSCPALPGNQAPLRALTNFTSSLKILTKKYI